MSHPHHHEIDFGRAFAIGVLLNTGFIAAEVVFGLLSHSLTLLADAGHNLSDVMGLLIAWAALSLERRSPTETFHLRPAPHLRPRRAVQRHPSSRERRRNRMGSDPPTAASPSRSLA